MTGSLTQRLMYRKFKSSLEIVRSEITQDHKSWEFITHTKHSYYRSFYIGYKKEKRYFNEM